MRGPETVRVPPSYNGASTAPAARAAPPDAAEAEDSSKVFYAGVINNLTAWRDDIRRLAHDRLELASLEAQRASESLITIAICALVAVLLVAATWLALMTSIAMGLIALGLAAGWAILLLALVNLAGAVVCLMIIRKKTPYLKFPATVASLKPGSAQRTGKEGL